MSRIVAARAYSNNEVAFVAWSLDQTISDCLGFEIVRIYVATGEERPLAAWVSFEGQSNPTGQPQTTSVWPVQKLTWRDLTLRRRRDRTELRPADEKVRYRIRPLVRARPGLEPVTNIPPKNYEGEPVALAYFDEGIVTNEISVTSVYGNVKAAFTNGILSAQWLRSALEKSGETLSVPMVRKHIGTPGDKIRHYLTGDVLDMLGSLVRRAAGEREAKVRLAQYELADKELCDLLLANKKRIQLILSNTAKGEDSTEWDVENAPIRQALKDARSEIHDRMFNNGRIGHNKFAILMSGDGKPKAVMTGSTNWTSTGLCGQTNNSMVIESPEVAKEYLNYWNRLLADTKLFQTPDPLSASTRNAQGAEIRKANAKTPKIHKLRDGTKISLWFSPNTVAKTKKDVIPPDLAAVFALMDKPDNKAIFFACFLPSRSGKASVIEQAILQGQKHPSMLVYGTVSDPTAMPNYVPPPKKTDGADAGDAQPRKPAPAVYDKGNTHVVRAAALLKSDIVGDFESELLKLGHAIIHDKIVVVDPLGPNAALIMGSHNLGYKASYENDENLLVIQGNQKLIEAYAVHILDVYDHYRFRAVQQEMAQQGRKMWDGFLDSDSKWLDKYVETGKGNLARYFSGRS
jgi:hypothetical protein